MNNNIDKYKIPEGSLISYFSNKVKEFGGINLAQGIPGFAPPNELIDILKQVANKNIHQYAPGNGNAQLLDLLINNYKEYFSFNKNDFLIVQGVTEAISLLYIYFSQIIKSDFSVLAFDPAYESYKNIPKIFNNNFIAFPLDNYAKIDFHKLENTISEKNVKILFISSPGNPFGKVFSKEEINIIIDLSEKLDFFLVFDAVYKEIYFNNKPYIPLDKFNERLFYVNSFSKMLSITGWRVGYLIAHNKHMQNIKNIHDYTGLCAPSVLQETIAEYLNKYDFGKEYLLKLRNKLKLSFDILYKPLKEIGFNIPEINGGYFIWAKLPNQFNDGLKFAIDLYESEKVAVIPGIHFSENAFNFIRFNIAREQNEIEEAVFRLRKFFNNTD